MYIRRRLSPSCWRQLMAVVPHVGDAVASPWKRAYRSPRAVCGPPWALSVVHCSTESWCTRGRRRAAVIVQNWVRRRWSLGLPSSDLRRLHVGSLVGHGHLCGGWPLTSLRGSATGSGLYWRTTKAWRLRLGHADDDRARWLRLRVPVPSRRCSGRHASFRVPARAAACCRRYDRRGCA